MIDRDTTDVIITSSADADKGFARGVHAVVIQDNDQWLFFSGTRYRVSWRRPRMFQLLRLPAALDLAVLKIFAPHRLSYKKYPPRWGLLTREGSTLCRSLTYTLADWREGFLCQVWWRETRDIPDHVKIIAEQESGEFFGVSQ